MNKIIIIAAFALVALVSCKKDEGLHPKKQLVTYSVECNYCLVYVEDNTWNSSNKFERSKNQHFNVSGKWKYEFENTKLDTAKIRIYIGSLSPQQKVKALIKTNDGKSVSFDDMMGYSGDYREENYEYDRSLKLQLR